MANKILTKRSRRAFLKSLVGLITLPFLHLGKSAADNARRLTQDRMLHIPLKDIHPGNNDFEAVIVIREKEQLTVLSRECTHLGCRIHGGGQGYVCPCHGSEFSPSGQVTRGPATRHLKELRHTQTGNMLRIRV